MDTLTPASVRGWVRHPSHISASDGWLYRVLDVHRHRLWRRYAGVETLTLGSPFDQASYIEGSHRRILVRALCSDGFDPIIADIERCLPSGFALTTVHRFLSPTFAFAIASHITPVSPLV